METDEHGNITKYDKVGDPVSDDDYCKNFRPENQRGFLNNQLYYLAAK